MGGRGGPKPGGVAGWWVGGLVGQWLVPSIGALRLASCTVAMLSLDQARCPRSLT